MRKLIQRVVEALARGRRFVTHDAWHVGRPGEEIPHGLIIKHIRVAILLMRSLAQDALLLRASALTFTTTLSIVPFLAVMFFMIQSFNLGESLFGDISTRLEKWARHGEAQSQTVDTTEPAATAPASPENNPSLSTASPENPAGPAPEEALENPNQRLMRLLIGWVFQDVAQNEEFEGDALYNPVEAIADFAEKSADPRAWGIMGILFVMAAVIGLMLNIESSFNSIWGIKRNRSWYRMLSDYIMILLLLPFVVAVVLGITVALESHTLAERLETLGGLLRGVQYVVIWLAFTALYYIVPNTRVHFRYALFAGFVAGTVWLFTSCLYVKMNYGLSRYNLIYSSFAQLPMLLMWIYFGWVIVLLGAELTFAYQNEKTFAMERLAAGASHAYREAVGLHTMIELSRRFDAGLPGLDPALAAERWNVPTRLINETLDQLVKAELARQCATTPVTYQPARSINKIAVGDVVTALREAGEDPSDLREDRSFRTLLDEIEGADRTVMAASLAEVVSDARYLPSPQAAAVIVETAAAPPAQDSPTSHPSEQANKTLSS